MILNPGGLVIDLYGEHIRQDAKYNVAGMTDDFLQNAVNPASPSNTGATRPSVYATQALYRDWNDQVHAINANNYQQ